MKKAINSLALLALCMLFTGCNTVAGVGKDIQKAGDVIEDAAKKK